jgi:membrane-associated protease RseP (regulator of RpoE activity)
MFLLTLGSVYLVFGFQWMGGNPLTTPEVAIGSAKFAGTLMTILLAHEMGHYIVAKRHGFSLSLPYFIPFPFAFGTLGAVIRLKSMPKSRTALLEMGAAGPLAGFGVALIAFIVGLPGTVDPGGPEMLVASTPDPTMAAEPGLLDAILVPIASALDAVFVFLGTVPAPIPDHIILPILANPPLMDLVGVALGEGVPGRYAHLDPVAFAGWVGCLLTAINLIPVGQLDGGHILNALAPSKARVLAPVGVGLLFIAGLLWPGWAVWGGLLLILRAWISLPVPARPALSTRAKLIAIATLGAFLLSFMPRPVQFDSVAWEDILWLDEDGERVPAPALPEALSE